ncbi:hypothetical protein HA402_010192 [Bradysia odoriphaga]|nr:hypothetical protein HA402_010192 [Bradysia odoriphaga]
MRILIIGGTGFIGGHLAARLVGQGYETMIPTRRYANGRELQVLPGVTLIEADVYDDAQLDRLLSGCGAVINLVGILHGQRGRPYGADFARAHVLLPERLARACRRAGVPRLLHISALGADSAGASMYQRSKGDGEAALRQACEQVGLDDWTIFRPSVVFGPEDSFTNMFARLARRLPVLPLAGAGARLQPVYVGDVVTAMLAALDNSQARGQVYELGGPQVYSLAELATLCARWSGHPRPVLAMPMSLAYLQARFFEHLPGEPLLTRDNLDTLKTDNVCSGPLAPELGIVPTGLEAVAPAYLNKL